MEQKYLIWSHEHGAWWRPNSRGYVHHWMGAGRYSRDEALGICASSRDGWGESGPPSEVPVLEADAEECHARFQRLMGATSASADQDT